MFAPMTTGSHLTDTQPLPMLRVPGKLMLRPFKRFAPILAADVLSHEYFA
jgi:hypothetical protein